MISPGALGTRGGSTERFPTDTDAELALLRKLALEHEGVVDAVVTDHSSQGGRAPWNWPRPWCACEQPPTSISLSAGEHHQVKIEAIATKVYGADGVDYSDLAEERIKEYTRLGYDRLPICMAKTHLSISHDPNLKNRPSGFRVPIREISASIGAGFLYPLLGTMSTMPGLPTRPGYYDIDIDFETGKIVGLS